MKRVAGGWAQMSTMRKWRDDEWTPVRTVSVQVSASDEIVTVGPLSEIIYPPWRVVDSVVLFETPSPSREAE